MEPTLSVLLYSKYSMHSNRLMNTIKNSNVDFINRFSIQPFCVDNQNVRQRILQNKDIEINTVPCLLLTYPDGGVEKYDGQNLLNWVNERLNLLKPVQPVQEIIQEPVNEPVKEEKVQRKVVVKVKPKKKVTTSIEELSSENEEGIEEEIEDGRGDVHDEIDMLEELPSDEEDEGVSDRFRSKKPVKNVRLNTGNYERQEEDNDSKKIKTMVKQAKKTGVNIMDAAKALEKDREKNEDKSNKRMKMYNK